MEKESLTVLGAEAVTSRQEGSHPQMSVARSYGTASQRNEPPRPGSDSAGGGKLRSLVVLKHRLRDLPDAGGWRKVGKPVDLYSRCFGSTGRVSPGHVISAERAPFQTVGKIPASRATIWAWMRSGSRQSSEPGGLRSSLESVHSWVVEDALHGEVIDSRDSPSLMRSMASFVVSRRRPVIGRGSL